MTNSVTAISQQRFENVFKEASRATGTDFNYLLSTAQRESGLNSDAQAPTSSATGLFQFVEQTWLETMKESGSQLGYKAQADQITKIGDKYYVADSSARQQILDLRKDAKTSALMAGAYTQKNESLLSQKLNRQPSSGELYAAHFLGAQGGGKLIELAESQPGLDASKVFPDQARANKSIFFEKNGSPKSVSTVYNDLVGTVPEKKSSIGNLFGLGKLFKGVGSASSSSAAVAVDAASASAHPVAQSAIEIDSTSSSVQSASGNKADSSQQKAQNPLNDPSIDHLFDRRTYSSRYALGYSSQDSLAEPKQSRLIEGQGTSSDSFVAATRGRASRIGPGAGVGEGSFQGGGDQTQQAQSFTEAVSQSNQQQSDGKESGMSLPRSKPQITGEVYKNNLDGVLPRNKPTELSRTSSTSAESVEKGGVQEASADSARRFGALDLSAFLDDDVFNNA